ncbi:MFS transporter, DHA2 family, multidrug resistance protein [Andreprevotia lacus DSM 23236]|jgi:DHA2 family multidrug resistance protein|uniref:MFS transporter, DHA2 family, multidrug resistance protein n=1 Tax=Andreprevotia lacus DSM 23236 TaxID=1121001 RepID=A0A1W1XUH4_9NEIS|nr:DHA2 family efflux MFS transporter permease subunit [Andreprevotia lacus]SMC27522.1 MFS transporter, DHA2 family, multidrug resistance protein [Andreprevotia lacus DSM 23236]
MSEVAKGPAAAPPAELPPLHGGKLALLTVALAVSTFMEVLDTTIVNVSVPHIAGDLGASASQGTWTISSYGLAAAIVVPLTGWLARRFGEVRCFVISVWLFTIMSALCGMADSLHSLVFFRFMQGLVSGPMVPLSQALMLKNYPPEKKGLALALWAMTVIVAPIFGPMLGGWITDNYHWPWIFYINVPVGILAGWLVMSGLKGRESKITKQPIDTIGLILLFVGVGSLQLVLDNGNDMDWFSSPYILALAIIAVVALTFLVIWELTDEHPAVDLSLLKQHNFRYGVLVLSLGMFCFFGSTVLFPLWLQTVLGFTATWSGLATAPVGVLAFFLSPIIGKNIQKLNLRVVASISFAVFGATMFWYASFNLDTAFNQVIIPRLIQGIGVACFFIPVNQIILSGIPPEKLAAASGLSNFFRTISGSFATAIIVFMWDHRASFHHARLAERITGSSAASADYVSKLQSLGLSESASYGRIEAVINQQAFQIATSEMFWLTGIIFFLLIFFVWRTKPPFGAAAGAGGGH